MSYQLSAIRYQQERTGGRWGAVCAVAVGLVMVGPALADPARDPVPGEPDVTPAAERAIQRGLAYLAKRQQADGSYGTRAYGANVAVTSLAGMACMSSGSAPGRGPYGHVVDKALDYVLAHTSPSGFVCAGASHGPMYSHGFGTLFLAEVVGMTGRADVREKLKKAVRLIVDTQSRHGGWRYQPVRRDADLSVTICQIMALRAARNAGITVPKSTVDRCIRYVKRSQNTDGGFRYMLHGGGSAFPRSAAGVVSLYSAGVYDSPETKKGLEYLMQHVPSGDRKRSHRWSAHYFYGHYYAVQAMYIARGDYWRKWYPAIRDELLWQQGADGSWQDSVGPEYGTAMACIILQIPNSYLPIFQR